MLNGADDWSTCAEALTRHDTREPAMTARHAAGRHVRKAARIAVCAIGLVVVCAGAYEHIGAWRDSRVLEQVGRSVDIGGRTLNIHCLGHGRPAVVFVSGRTAPGYVWTYVQREVATFTQAC